MSMFDQGGETNSPTPDPQHRAPSKLPQSNTSSSTADSVEGGINTTDVTNDNSTKDPNPVLTSWFRTRFF